MSQFGSDFDSTLTGLDLEIALLGRYLDKDHDYRHGIFSVPERALVVNGSQNTTRVSEWRNFSSILGPDQLEITNWLADMGNDQNPALFASATSRAPHHRGLEIPEGNIDNPLAPLDKQVDNTLTHEVAARRNLTVFHAVSGSYLVDWNKDNNFIRSFLANDGYGLTAQWNFFDPTYDLLLQHMGLGEIIGFGNQVSQNGFTGNDLVPTWRDLMGDPTLRMHVVKPASNVQTSGTTGNTTVAWSASAAESSIEFVGYNVYRRVNEEFDFVSSTTNLSLPGVVGNPTDIYMVRAVVLENTPSGTYYNASQGAFSQNP